MTNKNLKRKEVSEVMEEQNKKEEQGNSVVDNNEIKETTTGNSDTANVAGEKRLNDEQTKQEEAISEVATNNNNDANDGFIAALSYLGILVLIPLLTKKDDDFVQFHIKQGLILLVVWVIGWFVFWIPIIGWILALTLFVCTVIAFVQALLGKRWEIPLIGEFAKKINL